MKYRTDGNVLKVEAPEGWRDLYTFSDSIYRVYLYPIGFVVVVNRADRNVYLVSEAGALIWQIGEATTSGPLQNGKLTRRPDPFTYTNWQDGRLTAQTQDGFQYNVDAATGMLTQTGWLKL